MLGRALKAMVSAMRAIWRRELVAVSLGVSEERMLNAYPRGRFPYPDRRVRPLVPWYSPRARAVVLPGRVHVAKTMRGRLRRSGWFGSVNAAFAEVVAGCADRPQTWITPDVQATFERLHRRGHAYSVEIWQDGELVGGLYGLQLGGLVTVESMFHRERDASKVAMIELDDRMQSAAGLCIDCQFPTDHLASLGAETISRGAYLDLLHQAQGRALHLPTDRLPVSRLADGRNQQR